ncbi:hypothetical protein [Gemmobacter lutimaris]|nr:hypothetical protein [Gemmobacter lutimaris]
MRLVLMVLNALKYSLLGAAMCFMGYLFSWNGLVFLFQSDPVQLVVVDFQVRKVSSSTEPDDRFEYRPVFALAEASPPRAEYTQTYWQSHKIHLMGEVVPGRYRPETGEMRSDKAGGKWLWGGVMVFVVGLLVMIQAVFILGGVPDRQMPFRLGRGRRGFRIDIFGFPGDP